MLKKRILPELEPEQQPEKEFESEELAKFALRISQEIDSENQHEESKRHRKWAKNRSFYRGNQRGFWDNSKKTWVNVDIDSLSPMEQSILVINNQFRPQVKTICKEFSRSQTRIRTNPISDSQRAILTSRFADSLVKYYQAKLFPESLRQLEAKYLLLCGNSFRYTYYDKKKKGAEVEMPKTGISTLSGYSASICSQCGQESEEEKCPSCGGIIEKTEVESKQVKSILGYEMTNTGELHLEIVDPVEIKVWAGAQSLEESPYIRRKRLVRTEYIQEIFPHYKPKPSGKLSDTANRMYQFYDTSNEKTTDETIKLHEYDQIWLEPTYYHRKKTEKEIKLMNGKVIPEGTPYIKAFPTGMYICKVDGDVLGYDDEAKMKCWNHIPYDNNVDGFWADGLEDAVQNQQIINEYNSLGVENVLYNASPKLVINPKLINPATVTGRPKDMILMNDNARSESTPETSFAQIQGMSLTQEVGYGIESAKRDMREQTGALLAFNGQGDDQIQTATGASIARDSALALVSTALAIRAEKDLDWNWQILKYVQENWYDHKYKFLLGKYNEQEAESFRDSILEEEIQLFVETGSWMPLTNYEKLQNLGAFLTAFGIPMGFLNPQIPQTVRDYAGQLYNIPFEFNELSPDIRIAQKRLNKAKEEFEKLSVTMSVARDIKDAEVMAKAMITTISDLMGVEEDIDEHQVFINVYLNWLKTDEGQNANQILREAVKTTMNSHKEFLQIQMDEQLNNVKKMTEATDGSQPPQSNGEFAPADPAENPFQPPSEGVQDFSDNAKNSNL